MALTLGFTSMDQATETALRAAFTDAWSMLVKPRVNAMPQ